MLSTDVIRDVSGLNSIRHEWNELLQASTSDCVFLTHEWLATWWKHLSFGRSLYVVTVRDNGRLIGLLPLALRRAHYSRMTPKTFEFLGCGVIGSDYLDAIISSEREGQVIEALIHHLEATGHPLQLGQLRRESNVVSRLAHRLAGQRWRYSEEKINVCPLIRFDGQTWEDYLASLSGSQRYNFQRRLKNLQKSPGFRVDCARGNAVNPALDVLIDLHRKRWNGRAEASEAFQTRAIVAFHREFMSLADSQGWLRLLTMRIDDRPAAALYGLRYGRRFYFYQSGFDPAFSKQSVGLVMMGLAIKSAVEEEAEEYDLLHGDEEYKFHWARETRELGRIELFPPNVTGALFQRAIAVNRAARRMAKRVLIRT